MKYEITYHMHPEKDIVVVITARSEEEAIIFAKQYRNDAFSIEVIEKVETNCGRTKRMVSYNH